jgi:hypothetical protein
MAETKIPAFNLRMPASLRIRLQEAAAKNERSVNGEIVVRLLRSFEGWKQ